MQNDTTVILKNKNIFMAKTFSLAVYAITIHTHGNKNDKQVLSDFNNGQDYNVLIFYLIQMLIIGHMEHHSLMKKLEERNN